MTKYEQAEGIRRSDLWHLNRSPLHFLHHMEHRDEERTQALVFGAAVHKYILERDSFLSEYYIAPEINRRTKAGREEWDELTDFCANNDLQIITEEDAQTVREMADALARNPMASAILKGEHEKPFYWADDLTGEKCKCKVDCISEYDGRLFIVDYKTTDSCENGAFERSARKYGYQFQAGMYCEGAFQCTLTEHGFAFVAQEKKPPYACRVYVCNSEWIRRGYDKFRELIGIYHDCKQSGIWYGYEGPDGLPVMLLEED